MEDREDNPESSESLLPKIGSGNGVYSVEERFHVANFENSQIGKIIRERHPGLNQTIDFRYFNKFIINFFRRIFHVPLIFIVSYYIVQITYQFDWICLGSPTFLKLNSSETLFTFDPVELCRKTNAEQIVICNKNRHSSLSVITFLLGFYVSTIVRRWTRQVQGIPDPKGPLLMLGGLVKNPDPKHPTTDVTSTTGVLEAKKMIARYCLLSWTMCYNTFYNNNNNKGFISKIKSKCKRGSLSAKKCYTSGQLLKMGLLHERELSALQVPDEEESQSSDLWWVPLTWAVKLVNQLGAPTAKDELQIIPKDSKDVISSLLKFERDLGMQKTQFENPLPAVYKLVLRCAVWVYMLMAIFSCQEAWHHKDTHLSVWVVLLVNFPILAVMILVVLLAWLAMANIMANPYGSNKLYDLNLVDELELNIWRCSLAIQSQSDMFPESNKQDRKEMQEKLWGLIKPNNPKKT